MPGAFPCLWRRPIPVRCNNPRQHPVFMVMGLDHHGSHGKGPVMTADPPVQLLREVRKHRVSLFSRITYSASAFRIPSLTARRNPDFPAARRSPPPGTGFSPVPGCRRKIRCPPESYKNPSRSAAAGRRGRFQILYAVVVGYHHRRFMHG